MVMKWGERCLCIQSQFATGENCFIFIVGGHPMVVLHSLGALYYLT